MQSELNAVENNVNKLKSDVKQLQLNDNKDTSNVEKNEFKKDLQDLKCDVDEVIKDVQQLKDDNIQLKHDNVDLKCISREMEKAKGRKNWFNFMSWSYVCDDDEYDFEYQQAQIFCRDKVLFVLFFLLPKLRADFFKSSCFGIYGEFVYYSSQNRYSYWF